ncbi:putative minor capsid protein [Rhizobium phage V1VFA-S]|nr:putative minor capsid protein [Rhizobium phage V1VFA-S]
MIPHRLTEAADQAARRYDLLSQTFGALYRSALLSADFGSANQSPTLFNDAYENAGLYFERDKDELAILSLEIAENAHQSALAKIASVDSSGLSDAALAHVSETQTYLSNEIAAQVHRDIAHMRFSLQRAVLDVSMIARTRRLDHRRAQMAYVMKNTEDLELQFVDRRGRRTPTRTFVRSLYRQALLSIHNETTLHALADHGIETAAVMKLEDGVEKQIDRISIHDYAELRARLFHPNSNSFLDVETDDV